jgi:hypothetical protein
MTATPTPTPTALSPHAQTHAGIKAIETYYRGYRFRSRLEARWAVFLDALEVPFEYEPEGYDLGDGIYYLPDFWLPDFAAFLEIKPSNWSDPKEAEKAKRLAMQTGQRVAVFLGPPDLDNVYGYLWKGTSGTADPTETQWFGGSPLFVRAVDASRAARFEVEL